MTHVAERGIQRLATRSWLTKNALTASLCLQFGVVFAGGDVVEMKKVAFERRMAGGYVMTLGATRDGEVLFGCERMIIKGAYSFWRRSVRSESRTAPTWKQHRFAVQELARVSGPFHFGTVGQGLQRTSDPCTFKSEGLTAYFTSSGTLSVTTFFMTS